jgi:hypothetical protein
MKSRASSAAGWKLTWLAVLLAVVLSAGVSQAAVRVEIPGPSANMPYYARLLKFVDDNTWAVVFYRLPECVPQDFNIHGFFDFSPYPSTCPLLVEGFAIYEQGPGPGVPPFQQSLRNAKGTPVPIWFVSMADMLGALLRDEDGVPGPDLIVTVPDLEAMASLRKGWADFYEEQLQPTGGAEVPTATHVASGFLEEGGCFFMHYTWTAKMGTTAATVRFSE